MHYMEYSPDPNMLASKISVRIVKVKRNFLCNNLPINSLSLPHSQSSFCPNTLLTKKQFCFFFNFTASERTSLGLGDELDSVEILRQRKLHSNITISPFTNRGPIKSYV
jgi:hypothetical protein